MKLNLDSTIPQDHAVVRAAVAEFVKMTEPHHTDEATRRAFAVELMAHAYVMLFNIELGAARLEVAQALARGLENVRVALRQPPGHA